MKKLDGESRVMLGSRRMREWEIVWSDGMKVGYARTSNRSKLAVVERLHREVEAGCTRGEGAWLMCRDV